VHFFTAPLDGFTFLCETPLSKPEFSAPGNDAKISARRPADSDDREVYGAQQRAPLLDLEL
jgi:hypothetical protein